MEVDLSKLTIVHYPDPCLRKICEPIASFDNDLAALADRMIELMHEGRGVGLAAPQVGLLVRMFVMNATGEPGDDMVFVNPEIRDMTGSKEAEEGCLSIPEVFVQVRRAVKCRIVAKAVTGESVELEIADLVARICQHETDHLNGVLILDRMGPSDRIAVRKKLRELEAAFGAGARR